MSNSCLTNTLVEWSLRSCTLILLVSCIFTMHALRVHILHWLYLHMFLWEFLVEVLRQNHDSCIDSQIMHCSVQCFWCSFVTHCAIIWYDQLAPLWNLFLCWLFWNIIKGILINAYIQRELVNWMSPFYIIYVRIFELSFLLTIVLLQFYLNLLQRQLPCVTWLLTMGC